MRSGVSKFSKSNNGFQYELAHHAAEVKTLYQYSFYVGNTGQDATQLDIFGHNYILNLPSTIYQ